MILESIQDGDTNGLDFFRESEIGDTDGDGMPEILDGWGRAIIWVRWAPGHLGAQTNLHDTGSPDPFDPLGVRGGRLQDEVTGAYLHFPLFPLVVSQGPDDELHMVFRADDIAGVNVNDPYHVNTIDGLQRGAFATDDGTDPWGHYDNITNHQLIIGGNE